jgi:hypothetical protein
MATIPLPEFAPESELLQLVAEQLRTLRYGTLQLTIHDGHVVQVDRVERTRLELPPSVRRSLGR